MIKKLIEIRVGDLPGSLAILLTGKENLFSENGDLFWRADSQFDSRVRAFQDFDLDAIADKQDFSEPAPDYEHGATSIGSGCWCE